MSDTFNVAHRCRGSRGSPYHSLGVKMKRISIKRGHLISSFFLFLSRKCDGLDKNIITINDTRYAYLAPSTVAPELGTIVLIHGFSGSTEYWSDFMRSCR